MEKAVAAHQRVTALIQLICLTLLGFCLIERRLRRAWGSEQTMIIFYPDNRRSGPPAG
ncbi:hypothetical protein AB0O86_30455 [Streptomyces hirsutus]|uniref:hypothetical protein n=1 Tax=Streptomyces hirsutus TaxID=35620 RepID=UPI0034493862